MKLFDWLPRMPCRHLCRLPLQRFHWSCMYCRLRRFFYGKMDPKKYRYNRYMNVVFPVNETTYVIIIDNTRRLASLKGPLLKKVLTIAEMLAN
jgi:hypothetical protein